MNRVGIALLGMAAVGIFAVALGVVYDPFSVPFQDYDRLPAEQQQAYGRRSAPMQVIRRVGGGAVIVSGIALAFVALLGPLFGSEATPDDPTTPA
ncbi:MAG: hypothetical protein AAGB00_03650 [Planctomycetota bacterium]